MYDELFLTHGLSIDRLKTLVEVCSTGSISRAANGDPVRQSLYSRQLKELQGFFGVALTHRKGRGLVITEEGELLARIAREQFQNLLDFKQTCRNEQVLYNIGAGDSLLHWLIIPAIADIQKENPQIAISLHNLRSRQIVDGLIENEIDLGLLRQNRAKTPLQTKPVGEIQYTLFVPRALLPKKSKWEKHISNIPLATQANDASFKDALIKSASSQGVNLNLQLLCESFPEAKQAMLTGKYGAILPSIAGTDLEPSQFDRIEAPFLDSLTRKLELCWNPRTAEIRPFAYELIGAVERFLKKLL